MKGIFVDIVMDLRLRLLFHILRLLNIKKKKIFIKLIFNETTLLLI